MESLPDGVPLACLIKPLLSPAHTRRLRKLWSYGRPIHVGELDGIVLGQGKSMNNLINPFVAGDPGEIARRMIVLVPTAPQMSPDEQAAFDEKCAEGEARYFEARYGELPAGTYRVLEQGGIAGWHAELEIDGEVIVLKEPGSDFGNAYEVFWDKKRVNKLARLAIASRHGQAAADAAQFRVVWGGSL